MMTHLPSSLLLAALCLSLNAQDRYQNASSPTDPICPRVERDKTALNFGAPSPTGGGTGGQVGADMVSQLQYKQGMQMFPQGGRKSAASFAAVDERGKATSIASLKGKVVLVGLWSTHCDPSAKMLMEFSSIYAKREQFGFEILAVNFDENQQDAGGAEGGWRAINKFMIRNKAFFQASKMPVYTPGLGKEGASNFMDIVHSLPALFVVDREGRLAQIHIGYKEGFVGEALKRAIVEKAQTPAPAATPAP